MEPRQDHERRLKNIKTLVDVYGSRKKFCEASGTSYVHISQMFAKYGSPGHRGVGYAIARKIESTLGLPPQCLDTEGGVKSHFESGQAAQLTHIRTLEADLAYASSMHKAYLSHTNGLSALQIATLESIASAMKDGRFSSSNCMEALSQWTNTKVDDKT